MSTLTLVRHGQAAPFQGRDSLLTPLGERQAAKLGEFWLRQGVCFDEVHSGSLPRQVRTQEVVADCFRAAGQSWPESRLDEAWNEYDVPGVLAYIVHGDPSLVALEREFQQDRSNRNFQRMFEAAMSRWLEGAYTAGGVDAWTAFRDRVTGALRRIIEGPPGRRVAVFTSGGPIGFAVQFAMRAPERSFLEVNWRVRNLSVSEFLFDRDRFTLDSFNSIPHLDEVALRTWR